MRMNHLRIALLATLVCLEFAVGRAATTPASREAAVVLLHAPDASAAEQLATREVRRYLYLRTGRLLPIRSTAQVRPGAGGAIVVARHDRDLARELANTAATRGALESLAPETFWLRTFKRGATPVLLLTGGDDVGTLYAAYRFAETLGVRFYLHGDVVPDTTAPLSVPFLDERQQPLFALRGIQPFHDFPEGPDWWNADDYAAVIGQLPKLRMNFIGLHTYPEAAPCAEPTVWIGLAEDADDQGRVAYSYPSSYHNTLRGNWGYQARRTGEFRFGADRLFERDAFGGDVMIGRCPQPGPAEECNALFNLTGDLLKGAFTLAHRLGVRTCVGTETPLTIPQWVLARLKTAGKDANDPAVKRELYAGIFRRAAATYPLDYYWFWTPEGWTWDGTKDEQVKRTLDDLKAAQDAARAVNAPFRLATCGWVLGPQQDRALFDKILPKEIAVSCINREVGRTPVDRGFAEVSGRGKWAIPWLEDDPGLTLPQLWVGRMRRDAADARRYGCDGLMGIHWRTRVLGPNVAALAQAAWNQEPWNRQPIAPAPTAARTDGPVGGNVAAFPNHPIADTTDAQLYQTVRYNLSAYDVPLPNGAYTVTLKFCEPHYEAAGKRVFNVSLQDRPVLEKLDIFARVGGNRALDFTFTNVTVSDGRLRIGFTPVVEYPSIAAIAITGPQARKRINCGGPAYQDYEADAPASPAPELFAPVGDFYRDWAAHEFGETVGPLAAAILERIDGHLPRPADWVDGPGGIRPDNRLWEKVRADYAFVDEFEALTPRVTGAGNMARFTYWLETFRYLRAMGQLNCTWGRFNDAFAKAKAAVSPNLRRQLLDDQVLPLRRQLVEQARDVYGHLLATVSNPGELGTVMNWDEHLLPDLLDKPEKELAALLGGDLPRDLSPDYVYRGATRVILPTQRGSIDAGATLRVKVIVLSAQRPKEGWLQWRPLGTGSYRPVPLRHIERGVYQAELPPDATNDDLEYYVEVTDAAGRMVRAPATAPGLNHTVVTMSGTR